MTLHRRSAGCIVFAGIVLCFASGLSGAQAGKQVVTVLPFAVADGSAVAGGDLGRSACPAVAAEVKNVTPEEQAGVVAAITNELQQKLADKYQVVVGEVGKTPAEASLVIGGCLTEIDGGNATRRVIGAGMGASVLKAHVRILQMAGGKPVVVQEFDEESKGRNFGVGSGMLVNAMRAKRTSTAGDGANLADKVVKQMRKEPGAQ